jgi:antitoxin component of MazEF toxin-antitoxin module
MEQIATRKLVQQGGCLVLSIPTVYKEAHGLRKGMAVPVYVEGDRLIIVPPSGDREGGPRG